MSMVRGVLVNHKLAGVMESMFHIDIDSRNAEIGYWLGQQYWGTGHCSKSTAPILYGGVFHPP